jgi:hypothetical protein
MKIEVPLYFNWQDRGVLRGYPDIEWRRIPPGYYHNIQVQFGRSESGGVLTACTIIMFWWNLPAKVYNVDQASPPLPIFRLQCDATGIYPILRFPIGDWVQEQDAQIGFTLLNAQEPDAEFRVWAEVEEARESLALEQGYSVRPPMGI